MWAIKTVRDTAPKPKEHKITAPTYFWVVEQRDTRKEDWVPSMYIGFTRLEGREELEEANIAWPGTYHRLRKYVRLGG